MSAASPHACACMSIRMRHVHTSTVGRTAKHCHPRPRTPACAARCVKRWICMQCAAHVRTSGLTLKHTMTKLSNLKDRPEMARQSISQSRRPRGADCLLDDGGTNFCAHPLARGIRRDGI